ncbi:MAG: heme o synthase [Alphaproteobacteria bacterium]|nr:heme o synthase [Alphaproteobacteria bacterium]
MTEGTAAIAPAPIVRPDAALGEAAPLAGAADFVALLKPRVMTLVVFTAFVGMVLAPGAPHPVIALIALLCTAVGAGAAGARNNLYEADNDAPMDRTPGRPIPAGRMAPGDALGFGVTLALGAVIVMGLAVNLAAAALLAATILYYVVIYTVWLKRRTPQNIVIGGAAGALAPIIGWTAAGGEITVFPLLLFAIVFVWTPPHFWALSLHASRDYQRAGVPMLPVVAGEDETRRQMLYYAVALIPLCAAPWALGLTGAVYGASALVLTMAFAGLAFRLRRTPSRRLASRMFGFSILTLFVIFAAFLVDQSVVGAA